jgi:lysophospholipase L1-like esterase
MKTHSRSVVGARLLALIAMLTLAGAGAAGCGSTSPTPSASPAFSSPAAPAATPTAVSSPSRSAGPAVDVTASPTPTRGPILPSLLATIGDSYTKAYSVSPAYKLDHPGFSWAVGTARNDGVFSLLERFEAPVVADAAKSGQKMSDAPRQAGVVVAAARKLPAGQFAYVTLELGTNDLCDDPKTEPDTFGQGLTSALEILRSGLPAGSRVLILALPDFVHFRTITQAYPAASANLAEPPGNRCAPYLGSNSPSTMAEAEYYRTQYNSALKQACADIQANDAPSGKLYCTFNAKLLSESDFKVGDLSSVDYFHPSLSGQAKMAEAAWKADIWSAVPIPKDAAR